MPGRLRCVGRYIIDDRTLGKGNFAVVELATHHITKTKVAIKVIDRSKIREDYVRDNLYREARILAQLRHPNVVRLYETISSSSLYCLVTEYAGGGDLLSFVRGQRETRLTEVVARPFVRQLVSALHHLHERGVVHRDLKMENIMLDEKRKNLKIVDFGLSNIFSPDSLLKTHCGSPEYAAPELFVTDQEYGPEVDIWSLGINMFAMVTGRLPFSTPYSENRRQRLMQQIQNGLGVIHGREMAHLSDECQELLSQLIEPSPELRLPLLDVEIHPWITNLNETPFCPYQQPPKDADVMRSIIDKMACLLNVSAAKIETNVHEYRLDDVSAIYNLMMDQYRLSKGFWDVDHTLKREVKRPKPIEVVVRPKTPPEQTPEPEEQEEERMAMRTPTVIGMVRPSQQTPNRRTCLSADFELSAVSSEERPRPSAKTATFPQTGAKTRPFGNATTANSVLARYNNFGPQYSAQHPKVCTCPAASSANNTNHHNQPMKSANGQHHGSSQPIDVPVSNSKDNQSEIASEHQAHSEGNGPTSDCTKPPSRAIRGKVEETDDRISQVKTNAETAHDMGKFCNFKHGYIIKETALSNTNSGKDQHTVQNGAESSNPSVALCSAHREQLVFEQISKQDVLSCRSSRAYSPAKTAAQRNEFLRQQMQLPTRPVNAHFHPHYANPNLQKTLLLTKRAWHSRHPQQTARSGRRTTTTSGQGLVTRSTPATSGHQCDFSASRPGSESPRARLHTPIATLHSVEKGNQNSTTTHPCWGDNIKSEKAKEGGKRNAMPQRLDWKRSCAGKPRGWDEDGEGAIREVAENGGGINTMKKLQEMMSRDNVHQMVPSGNIRVTSAKIRTPQWDERSQSPQSKSTRSGARCGREPPSDAHKSCTAQTYKGPYIMDKHKGQHQRSYTHPAGKHDRVIDLNQQHMISLQQEASVKFEDSLKVERRKNQATRSGDQANQPRGRKPNQTLVVDANKAKQMLKQQQQQHITHDGDDLNEGTVALQLGQRVQLVRGSLAINSTPPPLLSNDMVHEHVFNVQASRDVQGVPKRSTKNKQQSSRNVSKKTDNKEWDAGYRLERKVSDAIKRAGSTFGKTPDLLLNCT